jgi:phage-related protein
MDYQIAYFSEEVQAVILRLPDSLAARYVVLSRRMIAMGPFLGEPHTKALGSGLFELRLRSGDGIARVFFCTLSGRQIVMLHGFVKKSQKTPLKEIDLARSRLQEVKNEDAR